MSRSGLRLHATTAALIVGLAAVLPAAARAQKGTGAVKGVVKDSAGIVIPSVEVVVIKTGIAVRSDERGRFTIAGIPAGPMDLSFRRISYAPVILNFPIAEDDTIEATVTLGATATSLPVTNVEAPVEHQRRLDAFESHRRNGAGHFITRADIEHRDPHRLSDLLRSVPGLAILPGSDGVPTLRFSGAPNQVACTPAYFVDGLHVRAFDVDQLPPGDIEGIELYSGSAGLPPEYNQLYGGAAVCGTIVVWTRLPGKKASGGEYVDSRNR